MTTQIPVGPELDAAVAKACGIIGELAAKNGFATFVREYERYRLPWQPSIDLNAAFEAANKAGLFNGKHKDRDDYGHSLSGSPIDDTWYIEHWTWNGDGLASTTLATGATPAEAICRAIVSLKGTT